MKKWPQSDRVTELQSDSIRLGEIFFAPDFNKLLYSLRSQGDNINKEKYLGLETRK